MASKNNILGIVLALIVLLGGGYYLFFGTAPEEAAFSADRASANETVRLFSSLAIRLEPVEFDTRIFSDPAFLSLESIETAVLPETSGRLDPFAPLGNDPAPAVEPVGESTSVEAPLGETLPGGPLE